MKPQVLKSEGFQIRSIENSGFENSGFFQNSGFQVLKTQVLKIQVFQNSGFEKRWVSYYKYNLKRHTGQAVMATPDPLQMRCVVIELEQLEEPILQYLYDHVCSYNWILREDKETKKTLICVWWREEEHKQFSTTPLRSFLKRLKSRAPVGTISI